MVERCPEEAGVPSSILGSGTKLNLVKPRSARHKFCGSGEVVSRLLAKEKIAGSNPVSRSNKKPSCKYKKVFYLSIFTTALEPILSKILDFE
ncbi:MAG: hypothetical protein UX51_C0034G0010 [Candidatus Azambacteria bacterium GW2011_GWF2_46_32]|uniref:Uncharacterized protein n=3 Tax=Candidatus Azamiibacteriota TaxID=1752741 RepID=A0A0G1Q436_9BACT|nr:MAG: hypothetical protein UX51_C0034G0010 [Candidatus Azambacteria bacterium GW2011_GWF2_46_32]KKU39754.1 MAG: hypothetical protein UX55_C0029G0001 [Candidatus Azambacteria bacterium GW2011_GWE2_46_45]KKU39974.1 MAG: hypothetical protein UX56_C0047G0001 [Candidatus Azambacteria bacterium GW2011_GWD2_46_48]